MSLGSRIAAELASAIAPPRCATCAAPCRAAVAICVRCNRDLATASARSVPLPGLDAAWSAAPYAGAARALVTSLKFQLRLTLARRAAEAIAAGAPEELLRGAIVPVPPDPWRARVRGADPAEQIALALARLTGTPIAPCLARRHGPRQVGRRRRSRLSDPPRIRMRAGTAAPRRAILVDDVVTTGATLDVCAAALRAAGAAEVVALAFARSGRGHGAPRFAGSLADRVPAQ